MEHQQIQHQVNFWDRNRMLIKGFIIGFLTLIMLIPVGLLLGLVSEREQRQNEVAKEISSKWASEQTITGPVAVIPYITQVAGAQPVKRKLYLLPEKLSINGRMLPEVRHRSLYDVTLYRSDVQLSGTFDPATIKKLGIAQENILWDECQILVGLDDARGLEDEVKLHWGDTQHVMEASLPDTNILTEGLSSKLYMDPSQQKSFNISLKLRGSSYLYFTPLGKTTEVALTSPWKNPAFDGQYLPSQPATISDNGFAARWKVLQVSRSYPQVWKDAAQFDLKKSSFGVKLLQPTDGYSKTDRSVKYAILIIGLTFAIFFFAEIFQKRQVHPLQYVLVGFALCIFYTLLLSISEYTGFNIAYLIASLATVTLIGCYVYGIFKKLSIAAGFGISLSALYTYIFVLIQLQDYALLFGSVGLFCILAVIMYVSRKVDWYGTTGHDMNITA